MYKNAVLICATLGLASCEFAGTLIPDLQHDYTHHGTVDVDGKRYKVTRQQTATEHVAAGTRPQIRYFVLVDGERVYCDGSPADCRAQIRKKLREANEDH